MCNVVYLELIICRRPILFEHNCTCFRDLCLQLYSNCQISLLVSRCLFLMVLHILKSNFFIRYSKVENDVSVFFVQKIFSQIVSSKGFSACFSNTKNSHFIHGYTNGSKKFLRKWVWNWHQLIKKKWKTY